MKKLFLLVTVVVMANIFVSSALAAGSLYKKDNNSVGFGYSSLTPSLTGTSTMSGLSMQAEHMFTDNIGLAFKIDMVSGTVAGSNASLNPMTGQVQWHNAITENMGYFAGLGYTTTYGSVGTAATRDTGVSYEAGIEYGLPNNFVSQLSYKSVGLINGSLNGFNLSVNYIF